MVTDPFDSSMVGFAFPKHIVSDIVTISHNHEDHNAVSQIEGSPFIVEGPGEYEIKGVGIIGTSSYHDGSKGSERGTNTMYHLEIDGVNIVHLGDLGCILTSDDIERLDGVDILFIPVGGGSTLDMNHVANLISELEPSIVIPMHYKTDKHNEKDFGDLQPVSSFLKIMGKEDVAPLSKFSVTKDKLPTEMQIVVLE